MSPSTQTICRGTILCFRLFPVSNTFKDKRGRGAYPKIVSYMFCLTLPKRFVAEDICNSQNICFREMFGIRKGAAYHDCPSSKFFVSLYGKIPLEKPSESSKKLRYWNFSIIQWKQVRSAYHHIPSNFILYSNTEIFRRCHVLFFRKLLVPKFFLDEIGGEL